MINNIQRKKLKSIIANQPILKINIGKDCLKKTSIDNIKNALEVHEVVKISLLNNSFSSKEEKSLITLNLIEALNCDVISIIGNTIVIYKSNPKSKYHIEL